MASAEVRPKIPVVFLPLWLAAPQRLLVVGVELLLVVEGLGAVVAASDDEAKDWFDGRACGDMGVVG